MTTIRQSALLGRQMPEQAALVPLPPKPRRRWGLFAAGVLTTCLGVLGSVWLYQSTTTAELVVAAARTIDRGTVVDREDLIVVRVEKDPALRTVRGDDLDSLVGQRALFDVVRGSLLTPEAIGELGAPGPGESLVSVPVSPAMVPTDLVPGDHVRFVPTGVVESGTDAPLSAKVVEVRPAASGSAKIVVAVTVPKDSAVALASLTATDVAVVLDSRDR